MNNSERLWRLVDFALPTPCEFREENFAGDPLVRAFCDLLRKRHELDFHVVVAWACPPDVKVLQSRDRSLSALIRSERLDTLLVEYYHQRRLHRYWADDLAREVSTAAVSRWMCEFLIGYRQPGLAILAHHLRSSLPGIKLTNPFRDETLASIPELERTAVQCLNLGHEIGHLLIPKQKNVTLEALVDGLSLAQHIRDQEQQEGVVLDDAHAVLAEIRERELDAATLLNEIEVDLFAYSAVVDFLCRVFSCPIEMAIEATLLSFECQSFIYGCKGTCQLLSRVADGDLSKEEFHLRNYLTGIEIATRARAVVRRAGLIWTVAEHPSSPAGGRDYNRYVRKIDALIRPTVGFTWLMGDVLRDLVHALLAALEANAGSRREMWRNSLLNQLETDAQLRLDIYYILLAFGCSGAIDAVAYLQKMQSPSPRSHEDGGLPAVTSAPCTAKPDR